MSSLVCYSSSDSSESENEEQKKKPSYQETHSNTDVKIKNKLPLPEAVTTLFGGREERVEDSSHHGGRQRSFKHEPGNWATLVYIPYHAEEEESFVRMQSELFACLRPLEFHRMDDYHVSLSRTVTIRHHWIQDFTNTLMTSFAKLPQCWCKVKGVSVLSNDEKTRSFLVLDVQCGDEILQDFVLVVDKCFQQYNLHPYYQPPLFHMSIGWCLGDVCEDIPRKTKMKLKDIADTVMKEDDDLEYFVVNSICMKIGNKTFTFPLKSSS
ncbi:U6 snRNA phosphodiesterase 1-like [Mya arenaria]|uniref:U6 snRNA phosphodiesterase 1-like n=1 Tax=Mya arenaria TaxID=6604 RepID=UPI0022E18A1E|nr:U6 snRNA phosphodiesterase 1-like [Mya arenaria]